MPKPTILVVDDESFFRQVFSDILADDGRYHIETAASGMAALQRLEETNFDLILADLMMPEVTGLDLLRQTRNLDPPPEVILATSHASVETAVRALKNGARDYLLKPCTPDQLKHVVRTCLEQRQLLNENSLLQDQIRLYQKGQTLATQLDVSILLHDSMQALRQEIGEARGCSFFIEKDRLTLTGHSPDCQEASARVLCDALAPRSLEMDRVTLLESDSLEPLHEGPQDLRSIWLLPLTAEEQFRGGIILFNPVGANLPSCLPEKNLGFLADQIRLGFRNACQYEGARGLIYSDDLTGLYNYRYLQVALNQEIRRAERYGLEFSVIFIDLDMFKNINDRHGHIAGSDLLREVAAQLKTCLREADLLFRYGGDEFTALLSETSSDGAVIVAERFRKTIEEIVFLTDSGETCRITATVGFATYPVHARTQMELIDLADKAMYQGKMERNVTRSASEVSID
ncbi:MAG TPA: diguanylate cyclase [Desulfuromonadales bacterium]|nr:diguanylate cyclase [Desulfuromonadales bacterium]